MDESREQPHGGPGHEERDVNVVAVTRFGLGLAAGVILSAFLMWFLFDRFAAREREASTAPEPMEAANPQKEPPEPRLQRSPAADLKGIREAEDQVINTYGWIDPDNNLVRIPIDRAMDLVAREGLPVRQQSGARKRAEDGGAR